MTRGQRSSLTLSGFRIRRDQDRRLDVLSRKMQRTRSQIVRDALDRVLSGPPNLGETDESRLGEGAHS